MYHTGDQHRITVDEIWPSCAWPTAILNQRHSLGFRWTWGLRNFTRSVRSSTKGSSMTVGYRLALGSGLRLVPVRQVPSCMRLQFLGLTVPPDLAHLQMRVAGNLYDGNWVTGKTVWHLPDLRIRNKTADSSCSPEQWPETFPIMFLVRMIDYGVLNQHRLFYFILKF